MRRRRFVAGSSVALGSFLIRPIQAQTYGPPPFPQPVRRAAIVIGLNLTGDLPLLRDAEEGAKAFADFLKAGGFDPVLPFLAADGPVSAADLWRAVNSLTDPPRFDQLVIYFAGHGIMSTAGAEMWLLSGAPENSNEALSVKETFEAARASKIANVVLIGDTCRSVPPNDQYGAVRGSVIFKNLPSNATGTKIDLFYACQPGKPALEVGVSSGAYRALLTRTLIDVFRNPDLHLDPRMFHPMPDGTRVVTNRMLQWCLPSLVDSKAQEAGIQYSQRPQLDILSDEPWNIGHVSFHATPPRFGSGTQRIQIDTVPEILRAQLQYEMRPIDGDRGSLREAFEVQIGDLAQEETLTGLRASVDRQNADVDLEATGISVYGARIVSVIGPPGLDIGLLSDIRGQASYPSLLSPALGERPAATLVVQFDNGMGAPIAVLRGFGAHITVGEVGITDLRYTPVKGSNAWDGFESQRPRLTELRALVREASGKGVLGFDGNQEEREAAAERMANQIRMLKGIDPTLGVYAAYAYDAALLADQVMSVARFLQADLGVRLFDPELLAWTFVDGPVTTGDNNIFPFCPVLRQGWELLRVKQARLAEEVLAARPYLLSSFITTFSAPGIEVIADAVKLGKLR